MLMAAALLLPVGLTYHASAARAATVCPAIGADTDCGIIITVADSGANITLTGQGPYDGEDDTLVGVVNNSTKNLPVSSVNLASDTDIFGFDGDGIDTYGAPGNPQDTTGYGGPNAYFTNINADQTSGTVNFITPIPPGGTAYFGLENSLAAATSCQDAINGSVKTSNNGPVIDATFTPNLGLTIQQAAQLCGFQNFDWVQKITALPDPSPFNAQNIGGAFNPGVSGTVHLTSKDVPFNDPPQGGGYTYQGSADNSYPYYYNLTTELPGQQAGGLTMTFQDRPQDPCLLGGASANTAKCGNSVAPAGSRISFVTHLAGVNSDGSPTDLGIGFTWSSDYNGTTGAVQLKGAAAAGTGTGTGGVWVTSVTPDTTYQSGPLEVTGVNGASTAGLPSSMLVYSGPQALPADGWDTLSAQLTSIDSTPIQRRYVTLTLGAGRRASRCAAHSDATGNVSCRVWTGDQPLGPDTVTASFAGDASYAAATTSYQVIMFDYTRGGTYVIGDISAGALLPGPAVTFWSTKWAQQNQLSAGPAPATFHGLETSIAPPSCRDLDRWAAPSSDGRYDAPPKRVPAYTAVIVTSDVSARRHDIAGNEVDVVIVAATPGTPGTGTIVADLC
jgi:hypothetical protein